MVNIHEEILGGVAALGVALLSGAIFGRFHGAVGRDPTFIGDRVFCGLLAIPLAAVATRLAFPAASIGWSFVSPIPILIYVLLLAGVDLKWSLSSPERFTATLLVSVLGIYVAICALLVASEYIPRWQSL